MKLMLAGAVSAFMIQATLFAQVAMPPKMDAPRPEMKPITKADMQAMVAKRFAAMDLNHDGKVTREEIHAGREAKMEERMKARRDAEFAVLDSNHDGSISKAEFEVAHLGGMGGRGGPGGPGMMPPPGGRGPGGPEGPGGPGGPGMRPMGGPGMGGGMMMGGRWFDKADANHDGAVTLAEAQTAAATMFDKLDTNHDGTISPDEMRAAFGGMHRMGGFGGRRGPGGPGGDMPPPPPQG